MRRGEVELCGRCDRVLAMLEFVELIARLPMVTTLVEHRAVPLSMVEEAMAQPLAPDRCPVCGRQLQALSARGLRARDGTRVCSAVCRDQAAGAA